MGFAMTCPPCGQTFESEREDELVRLAQQHARDQHGMKVDADEISEHIVLTT
jgi:predicted small metal-binding protein